MVQKFRDGDVERSIIELKDLQPQTFNHLVENFHVMNSALRYFSVKRSISFTTSKISDNFPVPLTVAGFCLNALSEVDVVSERNPDGSSKRYLPGDVDLERMDELRKVLEDNMEIRSFIPE